MNNTKRNALFVVINSRITDHVAHLRDQHRVDLAAAKKRRQADLETIGTKLGKKTFLGKLRKEFIKNGIAVSDVGIRNSDYAHLTHLSDPKKLNIGFTASRHNSNCDDCRYCSSETWLEVELSKEDQALLAKSSFPNEIDLPDQQEIHKAIELIMAEAELLEDSTLSGSVDDLVKKALASILKPKQS